MQYQWVICSRSSDVVRCSLQRFSLSVYQAHFTLSYTIRQRELMYFSVTCNLFCRADIPRTGARHVAITVYNRQHRPYPRAPFSARVPAIIEGIQNKAPTVYQNHTLFKILRTSQLQRYSMNTTTYCMNKTHRHPIVPYSHFEEQSWTTWVMI